MTTRTENALIVSEVGMSQLSAMDFPEEISCLDDALGILRDCILSLSHSDPLRNKPNLTTELKKTSLGVRRFTGWLVLMLEALEKLSVAHLLVTAGHQSRVYHAPEIRWNDSTWAHMCIKDDKKAKRWVASKEPKAEKDFVDPAQFPYGSSKTTSFLNAAMGPFLYKSVASVFPIPSQV